MISSDNRFIAISNKTLQDHLSQRITNNPNLISDDEVSIHDCLVMDEFLRKNKDIKCNISEHQRFNDALINLQAGGIIRKAGELVVIKLGLASTRSNIPINSEFHIAELTHIACKSRRRSAFDLFKSRGKWHPFQVIPRFNHPRISSESSFFRNYRPLIESIRFLHSMTDNSYIPVHSNKYTSLETSEISNAVVTSSPSKTKTGSKMSDKDYVKENCPKIVDVGGRGLPNPTTPPTGLFTYYLTGTTVNNRSYSPEQATQESYGLVLIDRFQKLRPILGRKPQIAEILDAGFSREEIGYCVLGLVP